MNETIVGSNSPVPYSTRDVNIRMQSRGFHQRCVESHVGPLESSRFESVILGSGHTFSTANEFRDAIYLMSVGGHFRYKFNYLYFMALAKSNLLGIQEIMLMGQN